MRHARDPNELLEVLGDELGSIVGNDPRFTAIQVPPTFLGMLAGRYRTQNDGLTVEVEGDHLSVVEDGKPKREFFPQTWTIFFSKDNDETLMFLFDIDTWAFRILREAGGKDELIANLEWARPAP